MARGEIGSRCTAGRRPRGAGAPGDRGAYSCGWWLPLLLLIACGEQESIELAPQPGATVTPRYAAEPALDAGNVEQADDTSASLSQVDVANWARRSSVEGRPVALEQIAVYGAEGAGDRPPREREVRVVLRFDGVAAYRSGELPQEAGLPRRLVLDLDGVGMGPSVQPALAVNAGGLERVRMFALDQDRVRVSFDILPTTVHRVFFLSDPFRVVMDFRAEPARAAPTSGSIARPFRIVLDPGHGGDQPGAKGPNGLRESTVALSIARKVRHALLRQRDDVRVVMTRDDTRFVSLEERAAIANAVDADLFVSIHLDASPLADDPGGVSAYVLDTTDDQAALRLAARENGSNAEGVTKLQFILASLYRKEQVQRSLALAGEVERGALRGGRKLLPTLNDRGVQRALFYVLVGAQMPAVLLEASFISRPQEAQALATDPYRQALADGIAEGIIRYLDRARAAARK
jgi:N-acetylmuramoyl-L-alanine amidase